MTNQQTKEQEKLERSDATERVWRGLSKETKSELMMESIRQANEDQRKVLDQAQDPNKIYWKG